MVSFLEQAASNIATKRLFCRDQPILVAVSGGVDSMVLLAVLHELAKASGWKLTVGHLNHQLRGSSSLADERLVRRAATKWKLPIVVSSADVRGFAKAGGLSLEMAGRKLRHDFLARTALERNIPSIALAHHLDDQIELFFLRLLRGSGSQGLAGMKWHNPSPSNPTVTLVRPLLNCAKSSLRVYAAKQKIPFREDASNQGRDIQRNRIRHELLPLLQRHYQAGLSKNLWRVMDILAAESEFVDAVAQSWLARGSSDAETGPDGTRNLLTMNLLGAGFQKTPFEALPVAVQRRCLQLELLRQGILPEYDVVERLRLQPERPIEVRRQGGWALVSETDVNLAESAVSDSSLRLVRQGPQIVKASPAVTGPFRSGGCKLDLKEGRGEFDWEGVRFTWQIMPMKGSARPESLPQTELFDADVIGPRVILRHWRPGDRFQPIGLGGPVKLQDLFVNQKVPRGHRRDLAVATTVQDELFWVEGLRISERFKLTNSTIRRLHWAWQRL